jgi:MarR family transcriptional regulator, organic hydroperoxide resistance regulator
MDFTRADALNGAIRTIALRHRALATARLALLGLYPGQEAVLLALDADGPQSQRRLADSADCEPPSITLMVRKLETAGLVSRIPDPQDARAVIVALTARGREITSRIKELWRDLADETVAGLTDTPVDELLPVLADLARSLQRASRSAR